MTFLLITYCMGKKSHGEVDFEKTFGRMPDNGDLAVCTKPGLVRNPSGLEENQTKSRRRPANWAQANFFIRLWPGWTRALLFCANLPTLLFLPDERAGLCFLPPHPQTLVGLAFYLFIFAKIK